MKIKNLGPRLRLEWAAVIYLIFGKSPKFERLEAIKLLSPDFTDNFFAVFVSEKPNGKIALIAIDQYMQPIEFLVNLRDLFKKNNGWNFFIYLRQDLTDEFLRVKSWADDSLLIWSKVNGMNPIQFQTKRWVNGRSYTTNYFPADGSTISLGNIIIDLFEPFFFKFYKIISPMLLYLSIFLLLWEFLFIDIFNELGWSAMVAFLLIAYLAKDAVSLVGRHIGKFGKFVPKLCLGGKTL